MSKPLSLRHILLAICAACAPAAFAQSTSAVEPTQQTPSNLGDSEDSAAEPKPADDLDQVDPPERVARLSLLKGKVTFQSEQDNEWTDASINRPLTTGDRLQVEGNARAELQTGALDVQIDERSAFSFLELTDDVAQIRLTEGAVYLSVRRIRDDEVIEVDTPHAAIAITQPGEYAIAIIDAGARTRVRTYSGESEVTDHNETVTLKSREQASFDEGEQNADRTVIEPAGVRTAFDSWAHDRALRAERSASARYVDPDVIGYSDLDEHGDWVQEADYGPIWIPRHVAVGWSPYRYGSWAWISPWGWTWVDDAPWGFAPFHYGRWAHVHGRWGWVPGPLHVRPVYAPALVAWVGTAPPRSYVSFSIAFGSGIGWFPLAPREIYVPSYHCSRRYIHNVNYANTVVVNNVYINRAYNNHATYFHHANRQVRDAVTVVHADAFTRSRPVRDHRIHVESRELNNWRTHNAISQERPQRTHVDARHADRPNGRERDVVMRRDPAAHARSSATDRANVRSGSSANPRSFDSRLANGARQNGIPGATSRPENAGRIRNNFQDPSRGGTPRTDTPRARQDWRTSPDAAASSSRAPAVERRDPARVREQIERSQETRARDYERRPERMNSERHTPPARENAPPAYSPRERSDGRSHTRSDPQPQAQPQSQSRQHEDRSSGSRAHADRGQRN